MNFMYFVKVLARDLVENSFLVNSGEMDAMVLNVNKRAVPPKITLDEHTVAFSISTMTSSFACSREKKVKCHQLHIFCRMITYSVLLQVAIPVSICNIQFMIQLN